MEGANWEAAVSWCGEIQKGHDGFKPSRPILFLLHFLDLFNGNCSEHKRCAIVQASKTLAGGGGVEFLRGERECLQVESFQ